MDFTDLIQVCLNEVGQAPSNPDVMFVDEAQDLDLLEMSLIRKWGEQAESLHIVGDPDQAIFTWRGADPSAFTAAEIPEENRRVLAQSYRVPAAVHAQAVQWISRVKGRELVEYRPRDHEGEVRSIQAKWIHPGSAITDAEQYLAENKTVMFLTTCSYMLQSIVREMRDAGMPFHNPYRRRNSAWNPLQKRRGQTSTTDRIWAFLRMSEEGIWAADDVLHWTDMALVKGTLNDSKRQAAAQLTDRPNGAVDWKDLQKVLTEDAIEAGLSGDLDWLEGQLVSTKRPVAKFPLTIARNRGIDELMETPKVIIGTVHSVKGAEADVVYLFPDVSRAGMREWTGSPAQQASVYRLFYVAMTRARETLVLCSPSGEYAVDLQS